MIRRPEMWLALAGVVLIVLGTCGILAGPPALLAVGAWLIGIPAAFGARMDAQGRTDAPGGYVTRWFDPTEPAARRAPSNIGSADTQAAIRRYVTDPDAEVEDLERDLDRTMRGIGPQPPEVFFENDALRDLLARSRAGAP